MAKVKQNVPAAMFLLVIVLLLLLLFTCALIAYLIYPSIPGEEPQNGSTHEGNGSIPAAPGANGTDGTGQANLSNVSAEDLALWGDITTQNAEMACLKRAKEEAGSSANLVFDCDCTGSESAKRKTYSCTIDTADPFTAYFANIDCYLEGRACTIESNYGTKDVAFDELRAWIEEED